MHDRSELLHLEALRIHAANLVQRRNGAVKIDLRQIDKKLSVGHESNLVIQADDSSDLRANLAAFRPAGAGVRGSFALVRFFVLAMRFGHSISFVYRQTN